MAMIPRTPAALNRAILLSGGTRALMGIDRNGISVSVRSSAGAGDPLGRGKPDG